MRWRVTRFHRGLFVLVLAAAYADPGRAQESAPLDVHALDTPIVDAGIWSPTTGQLTPRSSGPAASPTIYANTCASGFFVNVSASGAFVIDEGRAPSLSSNSILTGDQAAYRITGFSLAYATRALDRQFGGPGAHAFVELYGRYQPCAPAAASGVPLARFDLKGLPGSTVAGELAAYAVTIDLSGVEFCLPGDADGVFHNDPNQDCFGVSMRLFDESSGPAGFVLAGPGGASACAVGDGTRWSNPTSSGAGLWNFNFMRREGPSAGCINFPGLAHAGLYFALESAQGGECTDPGLAYCHGAGCPCGNDDSKAGCRNDARFGADLRGFGSTSVTADDLVLTCSYLPTPGNALFFMAPSQQLAPFGNGLLCVQPGPPSSGSGGAGFFRFLPIRPTTDNGQLQLGPGVVGLSAPEIQSGTSRSFQCWYRNPAGPCGGSFNLSNAYEVTFTP